MSIDQIKAQILKEFEHNFIASPPREVGDKTILTWLANQLDRVAEAARESDFGNDRNLTRPTKRL